MLAAMAFDFIATDVQDQIGTKISGFNLVKPIFTFEEID